MRKLLADRRLNKLDRNIPLDLWEALSLLDRRAQGIDLSKWALDWILPFGTKVDFAIQRTSWGLNTDSRYVQHSYRLMENTDIWGAYHFYSTKESWKAQADHFLELVLNNPTGLKYDMIWWDFEAKNNKLTWKAGRRYINAIKYLQEEFDKLIGGYANNNDYSVFLEEGPEVDVDYLNTVPLWLAYPGSEIENPFSLAINEQPEMGNWRGVFPFRRFVPLKRPVGSWDFHQYSWHGDPEKLGIIGKKQVDANVYNGTLLDLRTRLKKDVVALPPPISKMLPIPWVPQTGEGANWVGNDCGAAAGLSILYAFFPNTTLTVNEFYEKTGETGGYLFMWQIEKVLREEAGIQTVRNVGKSIEDLVDKRLGVMALVDYGTLQAWEKNKLSDFTGPHFLTMVGYDDLNIFVNDPLWDSSTRAIPKMIFDAAWENTESPRLASVTKKPIPAYPAPPEPPPPPLPSEPPSPPYQPIKEVLADMQAVIDKYGSKE